MVNWPGVPLKKVTGAMVSRVSLRSPSRPGVLPGTIRLVDVDCETSRVGGAAAVFRSPLSTLRLRTEPSP